MQSERRSFPWLLLLPLLLLGTCVHGYFSGRRDADKLCALAKKGDRIDELTARATAEGIRFVDSRKLPNAGEAEELFSIAAPTMFRRMCTVQFSNHRVVSSTNRAFGD